jgi:hypothetical protein
MPTNRLTEEELELDWIRCEEAEKWRYEAVAVAHQGNLGWCCRWCWIAHCGYDSTATGKNGRGSNGVSVLAWFFLFFLFFLFFCTVHDAAIGRASFLVATRFNGMGATS